MNLSLKHPHYTTSVQTAISVNRGGVHYGIHCSVSSLMVCHSLMLWIMGWSFLWEMQFLIPAVAQERVWSLVSPSPVFLVPEDSSGMPLAEPLDEERPGHCLLWHSTPARVEKILNGCFPACSSLVSVMWRCSCVWKCWAVAKQCGVVKSISSVLRAFSASVL